MGGVGGEQVWCRGRGGLSRSRIAAYSAVTRAVVLAIRGSRGSVEAAPGQERLDCWVAASLFCWARRAAVEGLEVQLEVQAGVEACRRCELGQRLGNGKFFFSPPASGRPSTFSRLHAFRGALAVSRE
jgi:hypothetical protein